MNKTLKSIQTFSKIGKVLSKISLIFDIILFLFFLFVPIAVIFGKDALNLNGMSLDSALEKIGSDFSTQSIYAICITNVINFGGQIFISKFALDYFKRELDDKTPFTLDGAEQMKKFGIITLCVSFATQLIGSIAAAITCNITSTSSSQINIDNSGVMIIGVMFIMMSFICKYGAQLYEKSENADSVAADEMISSESENDIPTNDGIDNSVK